MLRRNKAKKEHIVDSVMLCEAIATLSNELKLPIDDLKKNVKNFIVSEISIWKNSDVEIIDDTFNLKVINSDEIIKITDVPLAVLRKIRFYFKNLVKDVRNNNMCEVLSQNVGKLIYGKIVRATETNVFINAIDNCFKVPIKNFLLTDVLEENYKYLFYVVQNKETNDIFLTRVNNEFFIELLKLYIPEIKDNIIEIVKVYRILGGKINVFFKSSMDNALTHCLGINSDKLQHIMDELSGEKLNFIDVERNFYKSIISVLRIEKYFLKLIVYRKCGVCMIYVDHISIYKLLQKQIKHIYMLESIFNIQIDIVFIKSENDYFLMMQNCFNIEMISEIKTLCSALPTIRHLYKVCPSVLCVKFLISNSTVECILLVLLRAVEDDENHIKVMEKLMKNDSSIFEYKNK